MNYLRNVLLSLATVAVLLSARPALAWNATGHMIVAKEAWDEMTPEQRQKASAILKNLPHYELLLKYMPPGYADPDAFAFMEAATWPDSIRSNDHPSHSEHKPVWHYVDFPINPENVQTDPAPPEHWDGTSDPVNILQALEKNRKDLADPNTPPDRRAIALCWVVHLVGDIHQPLHATSLFGKLFPTGDKGGNSFIVKAPEGTRGTTGLHYIWDNMMGISRKADVVQKIADRLEKDPKFSRDALKDDLAKHDPVDWAKESYALANQYAYQNAHLAGSTKELLAANPDQEAPALPVGYMDKAHEVADRRVALAGHRLADVLGEVLSK